MRVINSKIAFRLAVITGLTGFVLTIVIILSFTFLSPQADLPQVHISRFSQPILITVSLALFAALILSS